MDRADIESNLEALGQKLHAQGLTGEILMVGGAYMLLVIENRPATKDIDAYFATHPQAIREAVAEVARERGLPDGWLNDAVKGFMHRQPDVVTLWASYPGLNVHTPSPDYIFAMKAEAARAASSDLDDLRALRRHLHLATLDQAIAVVEKYIPADRLSPRTKLTLETLYDES
jgi:Nucleotidyltransferase of unknown function (DUF6036)